jgi:hypothetical protein
MQGENLMMQVLQWESQCHLFVIVVIVDTNRGMWWRWSVSEDKLLQIRWTHINIHTHTHTLHIYIYIYIYIYAYRCIYMNMRYYELAMHVGRHLI